MKKILVIDDDVDMCLLLKRFLTKNGYEVTLAHNGKKDPLSTSIYRKDLSTPKGGLQWRRHPRRTPSRECEVVRKASS